MTATEYLGQAYRLDQRINSKLQQVESLRSLTRKVTASYDGETVFHTRNVTSLEDTIFRLMEAEEELNRQIDELVVLKMACSLFNMVCSFLSVCSVLFRSLGGSSEGSCGLRAL